MINNKFKAQLGGTERVFWFGLGFLSLFQKLTGIAVQDLQQEMQGKVFTVLPQMVYCSLEYAYKREGLEVPFNIYQVSEWIDEAGGIRGSFVTQYLEAFGESLKSPEQPSNTTGAAKTTSKKKV